MRSRKSKFFAILVLLTGLGSPLLAGADLVFPATGIYPGKDWETTSLAERGWNAEKFKLLDTFLFSEKQFRTDAFLVISGGKLAYERYARDYTPTMRHYGWSLSKSISMTLVGLAVGEGRLALEDVVSKHLPETRGSLWDHVTIEQLLGMSSGVHWDEGYESSPFKSDIVASLYRSEISKDFAGYRETIREKTGDPGTRLVYSSGDTNLTQLILKRSLGAGYADFPWDHLFTPLGMSSVVIERDASGTMVGSSYMHATPRDFARLGYLYLRGGKWPVQGKMTQIISPEWAKLASTPSTAKPNPKLSHTTHEPYGHGWWLNIAYPEMKVEATFPDFPADTYWAEGHEGQFVIVIPEWDLVLVRVGSDRGGMKFDPAKFGKLVSEARTK